MASYRTSSQNTTIHDLGVALGTARAKAERELLGAIYSDPSRGIVIAERVGVAHWDISQPDLRTLYLSADVARHLGKSQILQFCETALKSAGFWDKAQIAGQDSDGAGSMRWSRKALEALGDSYPYCEPVIRDYARRVLALKRTADDCRDGYADILHRLTYATSPIRHTAPRRARGAAA